MPNILVAEDDKFLLNIYRVKFTKAGYTVITAMNGQEAVDSFKSQKIDGVLIDMIMPIKDGFAAIMEIRQQPNGKKVPIIVASNLGQKEDLNRALSLGATDYIVKSDLSINQVLEKVQKYVN